MPATPNPTTNAPETKAICACDNLFKGRFLHFFLEKMRAACVGDAAYEHEGNRFCVMHYPSQNKTEAFRDALTKKIAAEDFNFCGVYFPESIDFSAFKKTGEKQFCFTAEASFVYATFSGEAYFGSATFSKVASFRSTFTGKADFRSATFSGLTLFDATQFLGATTFSNTQFKDYVKFKPGKEEMFGAKASLTLDDLQIEKPERLSFHSVKLRPHWFINTDPRKFEFIDVHWDDNLAKERRANKSDRLLSIAYRQLAMNAEENNRYDEAAKFRYEAMELRRLEKYKGLAFWTLDFWYWALSGYGERVLKATRALWLILMSFTVPYLFVGFAHTKLLDQDKIGLPIRASSKSEDKAKELLSEFSDQGKTGMPADVPSKSENKVARFLSDVAAAFVYSIETASLQKPEPRPTTTWARFFVGLETILAPLQAALLALAIRRKYMR